VIPLKIEIGPGFSSLQNMIAFSWKIQVLPNANCLEELKDIINQRRTDNTMAKRKRTKGETTIYKT
jgi:hypothetical protein